MIAEIALKQFRSYKDQLFTLDKGVNIIIGPNASGKTNLLEAVIVACQGSSYRAADKELINHNYEWARIDALTFSGEARTVKLQKSDKEFIIGSKNYKRLSLNNQLPVVLFEPNHLMLFSGSPEMRRNYLDEILEQIRPGYKKLKNDYLKTLRQRNALLKNNGSKNDFFPWDVRLSHLGGIIALYRAELVNELNKQINQVYRSISNDKLVISLSYCPTLDIDQYQSQMMKKLEINKELDMLRGFTTIGPHREDFRVVVNQKPLLSVASRGESRSVIIALKLMEMDTIQQQLNTAPIILLDDVFSELDIKRRKALSEYLFEHQVLITTTEADAYKNKTAKIIPINKAS